MNKTRIECHEIAGKTIQTLTIYNDPHAEREVHLEFTDGTMFSIEMEMLCSIKARHYRGAGGEIETLSSHESCA